MRFLKWLYNKVFITSSPICCLEGCDTAVELINVQVDEPGNWKLVCLHHYEELIQYTLGAGGTDEHVNV